MSQYTAPDGTVFNIPSDPAEKEQLSNALKKVYPGADIDAVEPTLGGRIAEFGKAIPRGGLATLASAIKGPVALFDVGDDSDLYKGISDWEKYLQEDSIFAPEAGYEDLYSTKLGGAFGSFAPFLGAGMIGGALTKAGALSTRAGMYGVPAGLAIPAGMGQQADIIEMSREAGKEAGGVQETLATLLGGGIGLTEIMPVANILKKVPKKALEDLPTKQLILEYMKSAAQSGTFEGAQEVAASFLQNAVARGLYNEDLPLVDSVFDEFTLGGIVGGTVDLVFNSMQKRRGIATHEEGERAERAKVDSNKLIEAKKAELAEQQGVLPVIQDQPFKIAPSIPAPVEPAIAPDLQIIENTDSTFSLLDQNNLENPVIATVPTQAEALAENKKVKDAFAQTQIIQQLNNDLYSQGLINSSTAYRIGESLLNPNSVSVGINTIIKYDPKAKNKTLKEYREELEAAGTYNKLPFQNQYTIADAQKLLSKKQFNQFASDAAAKIFENSEKNGMPSIRDGKQTIDTSRKYIRDFAAGKNIDLEFNSPAVNYAAKRYTGESNYSKMSKGQKELFLAKLHSLPSFNVVTPFPNFTPRPYSAKDTADFVATIGSTEFVGKDVQNFLSDRGISTLAASDFIRDLDQSGRAQFVKGKEKGFLTSVRQIRPNFEFDIARRAEGFNETPEEFGARLRSQGELKEEVIEQMVQNETARQEPYIPPEQLEEQTINFAEAMEEGRTNKFAKELRKALNARGLKDTGVIVSNEILSTTVLKERDGQIVFDPRITRATTEEGAVEGEYDKNTDIIFLSLNAVNPDGNATDAEIQTRLNKILDHEMIHALRAKDLITESEYRYLKNLVKNKRVPQAVDAQAFEQKETFYTRSKRINAGLKELGASENKVEEIYIEEAIAELFRAREVVAKDVPPKAKGIYNKIVQFFQSVGNAMKISGYNKAADIFQDIEAGRVGTRTRGEIRTLRDLDQAGRAQAQVVTDFEDDAETPTGPVIETKVKPTSPRPLAFDPRATPTTPPVVTPPSTTVKPIYDVAQLTQEEFESDRNNIINGLVKAKIVKKGDIYTTNPNVDSIQVVKWLKENSPNEDYKIIADRTHKSLLDLKKLGFKFPFKFEKKLRDNRGQVTSKKGTSGNFPIIYFNQIADTKIEGTDKPNPRRNGINFETMLHEHIHQATLAQVVSHDYDYAKYYGLQNQNPRVIKAINQLRDQQKRIKSFYDERIKFYRNLDLRTDNSREQYITAYNKASAIEKDIADIFIRPINLEEGIEIPTRRSLDFQKSFLKLFKDYRIKYQLYSKRLQRDQDVSEIITFGLTNRKFQEMLESIPYKNNKTLWQSFVESIRTILGIPAKLDTELYAFLSNTSEVLDLGQTGLESLVPRAPPIEPEPEKKPKKPKEPDTVPFATRPTKVILTKPFTYIKTPETEVGYEVVYHNGELNGFKLQLFRFDDGSWNLESPAEQTINGVTLKQGASSYGSIDLLARNKKEAVAEVKKLWEQLLRTGFYAYGARAEKALILDEGVTLDLARQDVPTFSRISKRGELDNRIADLDRRIYDKENTLRQDEQYIGRATYNRESNEIDVLKGQRARLVEERNNLPPEQVPLFSRAATDTSPAYMDLSRKDISTFVGFDEYRFKGEKIPNAFVMRLPIDTFLNLTTESSQEINKIKEEVRKEFGKFDPAKVDNRTYPIFLNIDNTGKVKSHEGRHRATLLQQEGAQTIPVVVAIKERPNITELKDVINNPVDIGINTLSSQYDTGFETPLLSDSSVGPIAMVRRFNKNDIDYALQVANAPDTQTQDIPLFSRGPRDESSGHVADYVPAQYGPPAHDLNAMPSEELSPEGYSTFGVSGNLYDKNEFDIYSSYRGIFGRINKFTQEEGVEALANPQTEEAKFLKEQFELLTAEQEFFEKLKNIKGNPNATITMYQAAPQRDLREGDLITPFLSEAQFLVDQSRVTPEEIRDADRARRRQEQIDKTGAVNLQQEKLYNQMEGIFDVLGGPSQTTPSTIHTYELKAGDIRWDGNGGWARWGYFPRIKAVEDIPLFSRASLTPKQLEIPALNREDFSSFGKEEVGKIYPDGIVDQLEGSRLGGTREKPGALKVAITNGLKNKKIQEASKNFLQQFTNSKGNLILFRSLNIPQDKNIRNYGQLPEDDFASTTLNPREAQTIGRNLFNRAYDLGGTWNTEILRYEVPMDKVIGYVPTLIQAMRSDYLDTYTSDLVGSGYRSREEIEQEQAEMDEAGDFYFQEEQPMEELLDDENYKLDQAIEEAEVVADLRGIKPTYQYSPKTKARETASITRDIPLFSRASRSFSDGNSNESIKRREAVKVAEERTKETPRGDIPFYNMNASDIALEAAIEFNQDPLKTAPDDIPTFSRAMPSNLQEAADTVGVATPKESLATRLIDFVSNPITNIKKRFKTFRQSYIDTFDPLDKRIMLGSEENEEVRRANNTVDTGSMAGIRMAERGRGVFQQMLLKGIPVDVIEKLPSLTKVIDLEINTRYNPLIEGDTSTGGLMQILSALQSDPEIDLEGVFALYGKLKRVKEINERGEEIASPITPKELKSIEIIEKEHPVVVEAYNNYQKWNNGLVDFASRKGLLDADQAAKWIEHSSYYPFFRVMVDEGNITAPTIAGGSLANNPLNMPMKGSEEKIDVDPIEAILRNSLSILTAAMKNDGMMKLIRDFELLNNPEKGIKEATLITDKKKLAGINSVFVFENGNKKHYKIADIDLFMAMQSMGGIKSEGLMKALAIPAGLLRDTVTRDPGFVFVNVLRDTLSAAVTSGAPLGGEGFTPIWDSFKQLAGDISSLEEFGVIGGYDFANDEGDVKTFLNRARRRAGLSPNNGMRPDVAFYKLWDGLGYLTTKSDGATRKAVANAVYKKLKKSIDPFTGKYYTEAQAQSEAAYQGLEIINFGRRGSSTMFRILTTAIPFLNARVQGLDVLYRSFSGKYSAQDKLQEGGSLEDLQGMIMRRALSRLAVLITTTALYYALVSDTDEYKAEKLEKRDDNWIIPIGGGNVFYIPIPFEVGMLGKAIPERLFDLISGEDAFSDTSITDFKESVVRQFGKSAEIPFLGGDISIQAIKPFVEAMTNRTAFTNSEIVPYFMEKEKPAYQSRKSTNELFRLIGEQFNISPIKLEHIFKGYTGTLGGYALTITDALARSVTGTPLMPPNIKQIPIAGRFFGDKERMGGLQQQFYKLREEVNTAVTTMNSLREDGRMDELYAYRNQVQGLLNAKGQVRAIDRYMRNWRKRRDRILNRTDINVNVRSDMLLDLQIERDKRLAMIPQLRQKADIPPDTVGVILR